MRIARLVLLTCLLALCSAGPRDRQFLAGVQSDGDGGAASGPVFNDAQFNLAAWWKGDTGTYQTTDCSTTAAVDGQVVKCWADQSSNSYNVSENDTNIGRVASGSGGLLTSHIHNRLSGTGKLALASGSSTVLNFDVAEAFTIFARLSVNDPTQINYVIGKLSTGGNGWELRMLSNGAGAGKFRMYVQDAAGDWKGLDGDGAFAANTPVEVWVTYSNLSFTYRVGRATLAGSDVGSGTVNAITSDGILNIMGRNGSSDAENMRIEEIAVFSRVITTDEMAAFETGYLTEKYG